MKFQLIIEIKGGGHSLDIKSTDDVPYVLLSKYIGQLIDQPYDGNAVTYEISVLDQDFTRDASCSTEYIRDSVTIFKEFLRDRFKLNSAEDLVSMKTERCVVDISTSKKLLSELVYELSIDSATYDSVNQSVDAKLKCVLEILRANPSIVSEVKTGMVELIEDNSKVDNYFK